MMEWLLAFVSIFGTWLNIKKNPNCWIIWSAANLGWIITFFSRDMAAETTLFVVYLSLSVYGLRRWRQEQSFHRRIKPSKVLKLWQTTSRIHTQASGPDRS